MRRQLPNWFSIWLLLAATAFLISTLGLTVRARAIPLMVAVPTLVLLVVQMVTEMFPNSFDILRRIGTSVGVKQRTEMILSTYQKAEEEGGKTVEKQEATAVLYLAALVAFILVFGLVLGSVLYVAGVYRFVVRAGWVSSLGTAAAVTGICYVLFVVLLNIGMWQGLLFR